MMRHVSHYVRLLAGSAIYAAGFAFFLYPAHLVSGGVTGVSQIVNIATGFPVGLALIILNIPIFTAGFMKLGVKFMVDSLIATVFISVSIDLLTPYSKLLTHDTLLASIAGGAIDGVGMGIALGTGATTGGTDIIAKLVRRARQDFNIGQILLAINVVIVGTYAVLFNDYERALYAAMAMVVSSHMIDVMIYGFNYGKLVYVISERYEAIGSAITESLKRGATQLDGRGVYSGQERPILMVAIKRGQIIQLKNIVKQIDPQAFVIVTETKEVLGVGFEHINRQI
ncbi:MAG: YitT family protein [Oscillospiraceae bacterium]|nr:YitT family protein [Oscillospiraceae bacterium]